jgi:uncharacterized protein YecT (DUF1311 family)
MKSILPLLVGYLLNFGSAAYASPNPVEARYSSAYKKCTAEAVGDVELRVCVNTEIGIQDARLNQAYKMIMQHLTPPQQASLRLSERAWITKKEKDCALERQPDAGGTLAFVETAECALDTTIKRLIWLERYKP